MPARYRKLRKIADGGMAELFLATQHGAEGFTRRVVLKQILAPLLADPKFRNMLIDEAHVAMSLHHSNIAQVLDLGQSKGRTFLVLELVDGWDLNQILARVRATGHALPPELALYVTAEVCRALAYAHGKTRDGRALHIVHRDISPHNVLVSEEGEVKLTDFGIAKAFGRREHTGQGIIKGKLAFMSPEQASGQELDARSDLFSVGTMLYLLFTGKRPFEAPTDLEIVLRVRQCSYVPPTEHVPDLPAPIAKLIERAMRRNPAERYQSGEELLLDLESAQRTVFRPAGQTELRRWLRTLRERDDMPPISQGAALPTEHEEEMAVDDEDIVFEGADADTIAAAPGGKRKTESVLVRAARALDGSGTGERSQMATEVAPSGTPAPRPRRRWVLLGLLGGATGGAALFAAFGQRFGDWLGAGEPPPALPPAGGVQPTPAVAAVDTRPPDLAPPVSVLDARPSDAREDLADVAPAEPERPDEEEDEEALLRRREPDAPDKVIGEESAAPEPAPRPAPRRAPAARAARPAREPALVRITSRPDGAVVKLGTRVFGRAPLGLRFNPGVSYELTFVKSGYLTAKKRFTASGRAGQSVSVTLKRKPRRQKSFFERLFGR